MAATNAERLKHYKTKMNDAGFRRLSFWVHPDVVTHIAAERQPNECAGRALERLLLGAAMKRPKPVTRKSEISTRMCMLAREEGKQ